jgi:elongation factor G
MDRIGADYFNVIEMMKEKLSAVPVPIQIPVGKEDQFSGVIDLISMKMYTYDEELLGTQVSESEIPSELADEAAMYRDQMIECVVDYNEELMSLVLEEKAVSSELINNAIRAGVIKGKIHPVICGSAFKNKGIQQLLDAVVNFLPSPRDRGDVLGTDPVTGESKFRKPDDTQPFSALIFKIATDPHVGRLAYARIYSGRAGIKDIFYNPRLKSKEKITRIFRMHSNKRHAEMIMQVGDIVALVGLKETTTGDTISNVDFPIVFEKMIFPEPVLSRSIEPRSTADEAKLEEALRRLCDEDPTCRIRFDSETGQRLISGMGELHVEILVDRLVREFNVGVHVGNPQVSYRETVTVNKTETYELSQLIGGKSQFAKIVLSVKPISALNGNLINSTIKSKEFPQSFIASIRHGVEEASSGGNLSGYPLSGIETTIIDAEFREEDSSDMAFKIAGTMAFKQACIKASPAILEPIMKIEVVVPSEYLGSVINDLNSRRGKVSGISNRADLQVLDAEAPLSEMFGYATALRSLTQGRAAYTMQLDRYEITTKSVQDTILRRIGRM